MTGRPPVLVVDGRKPCSRCKELLPVSAFNRETSTASGFSASCRDCRKVLVNAPGATSRRDSVLRSKYGVSEAQYDQMFKDQDGRCAICKIASDVLCVDHDHEIGKVRGLLCRECNFGLGKFADNADRLMSAAAYLLMKGE